MCMWDMLNERIAALAIMLPYVGILCAYSQPHAGQLVSNYLGFFLLGCCYISIGVLMSALTESQVSAAVLTLGANLLLQLFESVGSSITIPYLPFLNDVLSWLSLHSRYSAFCSIRILSIFCAMSSMIPLRATSIA